jgi:hypothetical protein
MSVVVRRRVEGDDCGGGGYRFSVFGPPPRKRTICLSAFFFLFSFYPEDGSDIRIVSERSFKDWGGLNGLVSCDRLEGGLDCYQERKASLGGRGGNNG